MRRHWRNVGASCLALVAVFALVAVASSEKTSFVKGPYLQQMTATGVTVMWQAVGTGAAEVDYGPTPALGGKSAAGEHSALAWARIEALTPATRYYYRVKENGLRSALHSFRTLPSDGAFTFVAYGDTRSNPRDHARVLARIQQAKPVFVIHVGDFVDDGRDATLWEPQFFRPARRLISRVPMFTVPGNHEHESPVYYDCLGGHDGAKWYSFDCSNAHFAMLDACAPLAVGSPQYQWLENDLASTQKRWRFVTLHFPLYSSGAHGSEMALRTDLMPLFMRYGVDIVFAGHDHDYERTWPIVSASGPSHPLVHVVTGGGGAPLRPVAGSFFTAASASVLSYTVIGISGDELLFRAYNARHHKLDELRIAKSGDGYANGFPAKSVPLELGQAEAAVRKALVSASFDFPSERRTYNIEYEFTAPAWSGLELDMEWRDSHAARMTPSIQHLVLVAGETRKAAFELNVTSGAEECPSVEVRGKTSLGEFSFKAAPLSFKQPAPQAVGT